MMVAGHSAKEPAKVLYVDYRSINGSTFGHAQFFVDADKKQNKTLSDVNLDTSPIEIFENSNYNLSIYSFRKAALPLFKAHVENQAARRAANTAPASTSQRHTSAKKDGERVTKPAPKRTKSKLTISHEEKKLGARSEAFAMDIFDDVKMSMTPTELDLVLIAISQKYPADLYKPTTADMLLALRKEAIEKGWVPSEHPAMPKVSTATEEEDGQELLPTGRQQRRC